MTEVMHDNALCLRDDFIQQLVDLFYRSNKTNAPTIKFQDLTSYLIEHEIEHYTENATQVDMQYVESKEIIDKSTHTGYIEKIYYFQQIDKVILFEQNGRSIKIYDAPKMKREATIPCSGPILAIEFIADRNAIAVSLADLTIRFHELLPGGGERFLRTLHVPSTQKCLAYVRRKKILFSGGVQGAIFAWDIDKLFEKDYVLQPGDKGYSDSNDGGGIASYMDGGKSGKRGTAELSRDKQKSQYITYIAENTPWFVGDFILCL